MFFFSLTLLDQFKLFRNVHTLTSYSILVAILLYAIIYVYLLFYQPDSINLFTKFIIYVVGVDLILSMLYYYNIQNQPHSTVGGVDDTDSESYVSDVPEEAPDVPEEAPVEPEESAVEPEEAPVEPEEAVVEPVEVDPIDVPLPEDSESAWTKQIEETLILDKIEDLVIPHKKRGRPKQVV